MPLVNSLLRAIDDQAIAYFDEPLFIVAFFLNPCYRHVPTSKGYDLLEVKKMVLELVQKCKLDLSPIRAKQLIAEVEKYSAGVDEYCGQEKNTRQFLNAVPDTELKSFALRFVNIVPHSAACERLFSKLSYIKDSYSDSCQRIKYNFCDPEIFAINTEPVWSMKSIVMKRPKRGRPPNRTKYRPLQRMTTLQVCIRYQHRIHMEC